MSAQIIELRRLYHSVLRKFEPSPIVQSILSHVITSSDKSETYEEILRSDRFFTTTICQKASEPMKKTVVRSLGHAFVLLGSQRVRNGVLGHILLRGISDKADSQFQSFEESEKKVKYAVLAEEHAKKVNNEYSGIAYACGYLYDIAQTWISADTVLNPVLSPLVESTWKHGLNVASLAWALATHERILISYRKNIFAAGLVHDFGKIPLGMFSAETYKALMPKFDAEKKLNISDDAFESVLERTVFDLSHEEVGATVLFHTRLLKELEQEVDFHHNLPLLKSRNPDAFLAGAILNIADRAATLISNKSSFEVDDFKDILAPHRQYIPLNAADIYHTISGLRAKALLS